MAALPKRIIKETMKLMQDPVPGLKNGQFGFAKRIAVSRLFSSQESALLLTKVTLGTSMCLSPARQTRLSKVDCSSWSSF